MPGLALVVEDGEGGTVHRIGNVRIIEHYVRALAAQLSCTRLRLPADACTILRPVAVEPVNEILFTSLCSARGTGRRCGHGPAPR